jgi:hypothetical protein
MPNYLYGWKKDYAFSQRPETWTNPVLIGILWWLVNPNFRLFPLNPAIGNAGFIDVQTNLQITTNTKQVSRSCALQSYIMVRLLLAPLMLLHRSSIRATPGDPAEHPCNAPRNRWRSNIVNI